MTNLTQGQKRRRAYRELLMGVLEHVPEEDLLLLAEEYASSGGSLAAYRSNIQEALKRAVQDAENYEPHYQNGCGRPILKTCLLAKKLAKECFVAPKKKDKPKNNFCYAE